MTWGGFLGNLLWLLKWPVCALERLADLKAMLMRGETPASTNARLTEIDQEA